jgi:SAM-dependent methyltransferase
MWLVFMKILDIGCGLNKYKSNDASDKIIGLDACKLSGVDVVHNLDDIPLPFESSTFDLVISNHCLEHIDNVVGLIDDIGRILKSGAILSVQVPHFSSRLAYGDLTHKKFFSLHSFDNFIDGAEFSKTNYISKSRFVMIERKIRLSKYLKPIEMIFNMIPDVWEKTLLKNMFSSCLEFKLRKI